VRIDVAVAVAVRLLVTLRSLEGEWVLCVGDLVAVKVADALAEGECVRMDAVFMEDPDNVKLRDVDLVGVMRLLDGVRSCDCVHVELRGLLKERDAVPRESDDDTVAECSLVNDFEVDRVFVLGGVRVRDSVISTDFETVEVSDVVSDLLRLNVRETVFDLSLECDADALDFSWLKDFVVERV